MKSFAFFILYLCIAGSIQAQAPQGIPYQSALRNNSGGILANQAVSLRFSIRDSMLTGVIVFQETHGTITNAQGMVALTIGQGTASTGVFSTINWGQHAKFLQVEMDPTGGTAYVDLGTQQMMSVPYALYAETSGSSITGSNGISITNVQILSDSLFVQLSNNQIINAGRVNPNFPATLITLPVSAISMSKASCGGQITGFGNSPIFVRGVCWSVTPNPTTSDNYTIDSSGIGSFNSSILGLTPLTTYYVRAYATNEAGTSYGNELSFTTTNVPVIGDVFQGGIVAYILTPGNPGYDSNNVHGIIAAPFDQGRVEWGCYPSYLGGTTTSIGSGQSNTTTILNLCSTPGIAARLCDSLVLNGYSDWYLPSYDELIAIYVNRNLIGGFVNSSYFSSSEESPGNAFYQSFFDGSQGATAKFLTNYVRAVRSF